MTNEVLIGDVKFWVDQNILHCKFYNQDTDIEVVRANIDNYLDVISYLSEGIYLTILFNFKEINGLFAFQVFKLLGTHPKIKDVFQYKAFLVNSSKINVLFSIYNLYSDSIFPNKIFTNSEDAFNYCNNKNYSFKVIK